MHCTVLLLVTLVYVLTRHQSYKCRNLLVLLNILTLVRLTTRITGKLLSVSSLTKFHLAQLKFQIARPNVQHTIRSFRQPCSTPNYP